MSAGAVPSHESHERRRRRRREAEAGGGAQTEDDGDDDGLASVKEDAAPAAPEARPEEASDAVLARGHHRPVILLPRFCHISVVFVVAEFIEIISNIS